MESSGITLSDSSAFDWLADGLARLHACPSPPRRGLPGACPQRPPAHTLSEPGPGLPETLRCIREPHRALLSHERMLLGHQADAKR